MDPQATYALRDEEPDRVLYKRGPGCLAAHDRGIEPGERAETGRTGHAAGRRQPAIVGGLVEVREVVVARQFASVLASEKPNERVGGVWIRETKLGEEDVVRRTRNAGPGVADIFRHDLRLDV